MTELCLVCFQTRAGAAATQITPLRYRRQAATHKQSMLMFEGYEIWYSYERRMPDVEATKTAKAYAEAWLLNGRPTTGDLRKAIETGADTFLFYPE